MEALLHFAYKLCINHYDLEVYSTLTVWKHYTQNFDLLSNWTFISSLQVKMDKL